ncbi:MAG: hypothetical protein AB1410_03515 [Acidobacteriota bacterium]
MSKDSEVKINGKEIDVNEIMDTIRKRIEERKAKGVMVEKDLEKIEEAELKPWADHMEIMSFYEQHIFPEFEKETEEDTSLTEVPEPESGEIEASKRMEEEERVETQIPETRGIKSLIKKFFRIPSPLISHFFMFYMRPYFLSLQHGIESLQSALQDNVNSIINNINSINRSIEYIRRNSQRSVEYIKLLHNLSNNLVVEISKLKVEVDSLRNRIITLENKVELVEKRERILEDKIRD